MEIENPSNPTQTSAPVPQFPALSAVEATGGVEKRKIIIPPHRLNPLKERWLEIYTPLVEQLMLQVKVNQAKKTITLRTSPQTTETGALQKGADFVQAFILGFEVRDALALLRVDDLYIDSFTIQDVKDLHGDHLSRAIGRIAGRDGAVKYAIENATKTRIVLADNHIHILGSFTHIGMARNAICSLILGSPPSQVYGRLQGTAAAANQRF
ncbi:putative Pre-rRNA-processing protein PNO1 [Paratrimastix pyriformis]|uniref:Pre-rRNA-processing protein PNO1 n=1 Tax=Paratrimastix pyriformis TaxID=342808 RepID=A0ABQ8UI55_9EUKA|nr:putative Pre-rRNA-processing protein PNO1 [Paratrimastix pyriformis]